MARFYKLFGAAFGLYSVLWIAGWMLLRGHAGSVVGLFAGTAAMGGLIAHVFKAKGATLKTILALFVMNSFGYFIGGVVEGAVLDAAPGLLGMSKSTQRMAGQLVWGVFYGLGFGAGLAVAFHLCQKRTRQLLRASSPE